MLHLGAAELPGFWSLPQQFVGSGSTWKGKKGKYKNHTQNGGIRLSGLFQSHGKSFCRLALWQVFFSHGIIFIQFAKMKCTFIPKILWDHHPLNSQNVYLNVSLFWFSFCNATCRVTLILGLTVISTGGKLWKCGNHNLLACLDCNSYWKKKVKP